MNRLSSKSAFSLIELLVVIAIVATLAALLFSLAPGFIEKARASKCASNLKQIGAALALYIDEHNERMPRVTDGRIDLILLPYVENDRSVFQCPSDSVRKSREGGSYQWNVALNNQLFSNLKLPLGNGVITRKRDIFVLSDKQAWHHHQPELNDHNKKGRSIFLWADGSVDNHPIKLPSSSDGI